MLAQIRRRRNSGANILYYLSAGNSFSQNAGHGDTPKKKKNGGLLLTTRHYLSRARAEYGKIAQQNALSKLAREEVSAYTHAHTHTHARIVALS